MSELFLVWTPFLRCMTNALLNFVDRLDRVELILRLVLRLILKPILKLVHDDTRVRQALEGCSKERCLYLERSFLIWSNSIPFSLSASSTFKSRENCLFQSHGFFWPCLCLKIRPANLELNDFKSSPELWNVGFETLDFRFKPLRHIKIKIDVFENHKFWCQTRVLKALKDNKIWSHQSNGTIHWIGKKLSL